MSSRVLIAILRDRQPGHVLHHEIRLALQRGSGVQDLGDGRMIHDRQRLPLGFEALHHGLVVHSGLDQFHGNLAAHRGGLLRQPDLPHAAFSQLADQNEALRKYLSGRQAARQAVLTRVRRPIRRSGGG